MNNLRQFATKTCWNYSADVGLHRSDSGKCARKKMSLKIQGVVTTLTLCAFEGWSQEQEMNDNLFVLRWDNKARWMASDRSTGSMKKWILTAAKNKCEKMATNILEKKKDGIRYVHFELGFIVVKWWYDLSPDRGRQKHNGRKFYWLLTKTCYKADWGWYEKKSD